MQPTEYRKFGLATSVRMQGGNAATRPQLFAKLTADETRNRTKNLRQRLYENLWAVEYDKSGVMQKRNVARGRRETTNAVPST